MWPVLQPDVSAQTRRLARWGLFLGLAGFITAVIGLGVFLAFAAIVCTGIALIRLRPWHPHDGHAMALCGLIAAIAALLAFPIWMAVVVPRLVALYRDHQAQQCRSNVEMIAHEKQQWAAYHHATNGTVVPTNELFQASRMPHCPSGGKYRANSVGTPPECSITWHNVR